MIPSLPDNTGTQLALGILLIALCVALEAVATVLVLEQRRRRKERIRQHYSIAYGIWHLVLVTTTLIAVHFVQIFVWVAAFLLTGAFERFYHATFYSFSTFTTLGFANYQPAVTWELMGATEGACGAMLIGWTAAIIYAAGSSFYNDVVDGRAT
jgi:hypothetical protein